MAAALNPADLVQEAQDTLTAALAAAPFLAAHPELPVARIHAAGHDGRQHCPYLEVHLDRDGAAITAFASKLSLPVIQPTRRCDLRVDLHVDTVHIAVSACTGFSDTYAGTGSDQDHHA